MTEGHPGLDPGSRKITDKDMDEYIDKAAILIEALPYIKKFRGKEVLIKYGGAAMQDPEIQANFLKDLVFMNYIGMKPILVHGGGQFISKNLEKAGIESEFIHGLRRTSKEAIKVVVQTLADVNKELVHDINSYGARAIGMSGHDAEILHVKQHSPEVEFVGSVEQVNILPIREMTDVNIIPVIYGVGIDSKGATYNINADEAASKIAEAMGVQKIVLLTNVQGIMKDPNDESSLISSIHADEVEGLINDGVIQGGMIPKINACVHTLKQGVRKAHIIDGRIKHSLLLEIFTDKGIGTEIIL